MITLRDLADVQYVGSVIRSMSGQQGVIYKFHFQSFEQYVYVTVRWCDGTEQTYEPIDKNTEVLSIGGANDSIGS